MKPEAKRESVNYVDETGILLYSNVREHCELFKMKNWCHLNEGDLFFEKSSGRTINCVPFHVCASIRSLKSYYYRFGCSGSLYAACVVQKTIHSLVNWNEL